MLDNAIRRLRSAALLPAQAAIDAPLAGQPVDRFAFPVAGWVWLGSDHERIEAVEIWDGDTLLGETRALTHRPDVCSALRLPVDRRTGFSIVAGHSGAARGAILPLVVRARLANGTRTLPLAHRQVRSLGNDDRHAPLVMAPDDAVRGRPSATDTLATPPDPLQVRQVGSVWGPAFYREGRVILNQIAAAFAHAGKPLGEASAILDFGCGCGRVLAGFADMDHSGALWGCDIDAEAIAWNKANLGAFAAFRVNPAVPPAPFETGQFDAIYCVSVFTHLPEELQFAWLTELRRLLRPGGVLVASVHGGYYSSNVDEAFRAELATRGFAYRTGAQTAGLPDFYMVAMHSESYVRSKWTRFFKLVAIHERLIHGAHDAIVLRREAD